MSIPYIEYVHNKREGSGQIALWISSGAVLLRQPKNRDKTKVTGHIWTFPGAWFLRFVTEGERGRFRRALKDRC